MEAPLQLALPFSLKEAVSLKRASAILGVEYTTVYRMMQDHQIEFYQRSERGVFHIRWVSLVEYCDQLRKDFGLPDRRPQLSSPIFRHLDRDIPPFPLDQNMTVEEVMTALQFGRTRVIKLVSVGALEGYHLTKNSPWRIYRPSVEKYLARLHQMSMVRRPLAGRALPLRRSPV